ncbi:MerR family transcriptional regulator [Ligilactobacillus sp. WILCCON 0076]|uniref:MerR family transcriptional regulator n=1 Tax=Ligilactobacillus ubinensis TaxID=2876789 RepID=A0A9X2JKG6_9LACO|nr:MerR family transcriptional regulator [Ligilactobacillus ubinensis]
MVRLTGVRYSTLKFYTKDVLLAFEQKEENLTRRYKRVDTLERISLIWAINSSNKGAHH